MRIKLSDHCHCRKFGFTHFGVNIFGQKSACVNLLTNVMSDPRDYHALACSPLTGRSFGRLIGVLTLSLVSSLGLRLTSHTSEYHVLFLFQTTASTNRIG